MNIINAPINGLLIIERDKYKDNRGDFSRLFCQETLSKYSKAFAENKSNWQINHSHTKSAGTIRGMHYQTPPMAEDKLITCINGEVYDVAIDLRVNSPTFLKWHSIILSKDNAKSFLIPKGFAHGFQLLSEKADMIYLHSTSYSPQNESGINPLDPIIDINWLLPPLDNKISEKDKNRKFIDSNFHGVIL